MNVDSFYISNYNIYNVNFFGSKFPGKGFVEDSISKILSEII